MSGIATGDILNLGIEFFDDASSEIPDDQDDELPEGSDDVDPDELDDDDAAASDDDDADSDDDDDDDDESAEDPEQTAMRESLRAELIPEVRKEITASIAESFRVYQSEMDKRVSTRDRTITHLGKQIEQYDAFLKSEFTEANGHDPAKLVALENRLFRVRDSVEARHEQLATQWQTASQNIEQRFEHYAKEAVSDPKGQQLADPKAVNSDPEVQRLKKVAVRLARQWYGSGGVEGTPENQAALDAFDQLKQRQLAVGRALVAGKTKTKTTARTRQVRADQKARGVQAPVSRTGGTGKMTEEKAWAQAEKSHPSDSHAQFLAYVKIMDAHGISTEG